MRITLAQLEAFFWTAQLGSVQKAAQQLNLAQPSVSLRLRDLRAAVQVDLFERMGKGLCLTAEGRALLAQTRTVLDEVRKIHAPGADAVPSGPVRLGIAEGLAVVCLPSLLQALTEAFPELRPELTITTSATLEPMLLRDALDLAILVDPMEFGTQRLVPLGAQATCWAAPASWSLPGPVRPADLWSVPIISNQAPSATYRQTVDWFATAGVAPAKMSICSSVAVCAQLIAAGIAAGILPLKMAQTYAAEGQMQILASAPPIAPGKVYVGARLGAAPQMIDQITAVIRRVLRALDYLAQYA